MLMSIYITLKLLYLRFGSSYKEYMHKLKGHIVFKISSFVLMLSLFVPSVVSFIHDIQHEHTYLMCDNSGETHLHNEAEECNFFIFKLNTEYHSINTGHSIAMLVFPTERIYTLYSFPYNHQNLSYSLRAPPFLV